MGKIKPTTKTQVSGHKFFKRRIEHGLVLGDIRMIHDPLARRKRAAVFGAAGSALIAVGAGAMAVFSPQADPGDAKIIRSESGQLFSKVGESYHPTVNLSSARLIAGKPDDPQQVADKIMEDFPKSVPIGIVDAPSIIDVDSAHGAIEWYACQAEQRAESRVDVAPGRTIVLAVPNWEKQENPLVFPLSEDGGAAHTQAGILTRVSGQDWLVTEDGRIMLPPSESSEGRAMRRVFDITEETPIWEPPADIVSLIHEKPGLKWPDKTRATIWTNAEDSMADTGWFYIAGKLSPLTEPQLLVLRDSGYRSVPVSVEQIAATATDSEQSPTHIPTEYLHFLDPVAQPLCVAADGTMFLADKTSVENTSELSGEGTATHFRGTGSAVAVETEAGRHIISETGLRHSISAEGVTAIGFRSIHPIPWLILKLLPAGTDLTRNEALRPLY